MYTVGKPGKEGGPLQGCTYTRKPVYAGGRVVCIREARQGGRPGDKFTIVYMEAGLCRRPSCKHLRSPTLRDAHCKDVHTYGSWSMPEALLCVKRPPTKRETSRNPSPNVKPIPVHTPLADIHPHPHPTFTQSSPKPHRGITPALFTSDSCTQHLPLPADTISIKNHNQYHQGWDSNGYGHAKQAVATTDKAGFKLLRP